MSGMKDKETGFSGRTKWAPEINPTSRSQEAVATDPSPFSASQYPDSICAEELSIVLIGPDESRRSSAMIALASSAGAGVREYSSYPESADDIPPMLADNPDAVLI